jgi:predicted TIM-barrel fold metal-dependent hydrolase
MTSPTPPSAASTPPRAADATSAAARPRADWLALQPSEPVLAPALPIIDPHHHLWDRGGDRYLLDELLTDIGWADGAHAGHRVLATVYVECLWAWHADGPAALQPVGETAFVAAVADAAAARGPATPQVGAGIVGFADLLLGDAVEPVLQAHLVAGRGRFRGVRHAAGWDASDQVRNSHSNPPPGLYADVHFRAGFARLAPLGLSFEAWQYHPQLPEVTALARAFPDTAIVLNHLGGPLGIGPYAGQGEAVFARWRTDMAALAACPNVSVKLGGLGMRIGPFDFHRRPQPAGSAQLAQAWQPWVDHAIACFGAARCMFESNFPVDQASTGYTVLWNAFKRLAAAGSADEQAALLAGTARRVYRLDEV